MKGASSPHQSPQRHSAPRERAAAEALSSAGIGNQIGAVLIDADDPAAVEQQHETHAVEPRIGPIGIASECVEFRPAAGDGDVSPTDDKAVGRVDDPTPSLVREPGCGRCCRKAAAAVNPRLPRLGNFSSFSNFSSGGGVIHPR